MRYEIKYILEPAHIFQFERWLLQQPLLRREHPKRLVNSVYFDTCNLRAGEENIAGLPDRRKIRVRWYGSLESTAPELALEIKTKRGRLGSKLIKPFGANVKVFKGLQVKQMQQVFEESESVRKISPAIVGHIPSLYVGYLRQYFTHASGIRITIDSGLEFSDLMRKVEGISNAKLAYQKYIVEFKFPPNIKDIAAHLMRELPFYPVRSSKYLIGLSASSKALYI